MTKTAPKTTVLATSVYILLSLLELNKPRVSVGLEIEVSTMSNSTTQQNQRTEAQHVVPRCYLKRFTYNGQRLHYFDKTTGRQGEVNIKSVAQYKYFYDIPGQFLVSGTDEEQVLEKRLGKREDKLNILLEALLATVETEDITPDKKEALAYYFLLQASRTAVTRARMIALFKDQGAGIKELIQRENYTGPHPDLSALEKFSTDAVPLWHGHLLMNAQQMRVMSMPLLELIWYMGVNDTEELLYTSDAPAMMGRPPSNPILGSGVFGDGPLLLLYPLTPRRILIAVDRATQGEDVSFENMTKPLCLQAVQWCNAQQVFGCNQYVYNQASDFRIAQRVRQERPDMCNTNG
jgi:hypothetical protein